MAPLLQRLDAGVLTLTLDRPDRQNTLNRESIEALHEALERAELDAAVHVVAIRGAGADFCAGADRDELLASADRTLADNERDALRLGQLFRRCRELPKPVVAVVRGRALAAGAGLVTACDIAIAAESATIGYPEIRHGAVPAMALPLLRRAVGERVALELVLTGRSLPASDARAMGLFARVVPDAALDAEAAAVLASLAGAPRSALALTKQLVYQLDGRALADGFALGARTDALARANAGFGATLSRFLRR